MSRKKNVFSFTVILLMLPAVIYSPAVTSGINLNVDLQGHRGSRGLEPENTWPAVRTAILEGMTTIEIDLHFTKDEKFILHHNYRLIPKKCRTLDGHRVPRVRVSEVTSTWLANIQCARTLDEAKQSEAALITLERLFDNLKVFEAKHKNLIRPAFNLELKLDLANKKKRVKIARRLVQLLEYKKMIPRVIVASFHYHTLATIKKENRSITTYANLDKQRHFKLLKRLVTIRNYNRRSSYKLIDGVSIHQKNAIKDIIDVSHENELKIYVYTVNKPKKMKKYLNLGVDGIITDYPNRLRHVFANWYTSTVARELFIAMQG